MLTVMKHCDAFRLQTVTYHENLLVSLLYIVRSEQRFYSKANDIIKYTIYCKQKTPHKFCKTFSLQDIFLQCKDPESRKFFLMLFLLKDFLFRPQCSYSFPEITVVAIDSLGMISSYFWDFAEVPTKDLQGKKELSTKRIETPNIFF